MRPFLIIVIGFNLCWQASQAQLSGERLALNNIRKLKWERAHALLDKAMHKDSINASAKYVCALFFFNEKNPAYHVDSAHQYSLAALADLGRTNARQREKLRKFPLDSAILLRLQRRIDSAAFERAKAFNTEQAYLHFLQYFPDASYKTQAIELRDEVAYLDALRQNTYQGYNGFLQKYPDASQAPEARKRYEKLLYDSKTSDQRLRSFEYFLAEYPASPFRHEAERNIFEIATASGNRQAFEAFIEKYPASPYVKRAKDILMHTLLEHQTYQELPGFLLSDSVLAIEAAARSYLVPVLKDGLFVFMNAKGEEVIRTKAKAIADTYLCGNINEDIVVIGNQIFTRSGAIIYEGPLDEVDDIGYGFITVRRNGVLTVLHKTGFRIPEANLEAAKLLNGKLLALQKNNHWSVWTLAGKKIQGYEYDDLFTIGDVITLKRTGRYRLVTISEMALVADRQPLKTYDFFDEVKPVKNDCLWVRTGEFEGILNQQLDVLIPFEKHILSADEKIFVATTAYGKRIFSGEGREAGLFENVKVNFWWTAVKQAGQWRLFDVNNYHYESMAGDSIGFVGPFAAVYHQDSVTVYLDGRHSYPFPQTHLEFLPGKDSMSYLVVEEGERKSVFQGDGQKLFSVACDKISYAGRAVFILSRKEKKGLWSSDGKMLLPVEFDAIGGLRDHTISVLKNMKFGLFDINTGKLIKPQYDKNLIPYNDNILIAFKEGRYGLLDWNNKIIARFEFDEIIFWNDSAALVRKNDRWIVYEIATQKALLAGIHHYKLVSAHADEKLLIIQQQNLEGVISSSSGTIIPVNFAAVKNLGSSEEPLYFAEKHVEEASIYVVIYYNKEGELLRREVYEEEDYEKIYCSEK